MVEHDTVNWLAHVQLEKWHDSAAHEAGAAPDEVLEVERNILMNVGINRLLDLLIGVAGTAYNAANSRVGVGNGTLAAAATQTDLNGASKYFKLVDSVSRTNQTVTWVATFGSADGNFAWEEWCIDNGAASSATVVAPLLNRRVAVMGTKAAASTWVITVTVTVA